MTACQYAKSECPTLLKLEKKPTGKWISRALLCVSEKTGQLDNGERLAAINACPCSKEILNLMAKDGGSLRFGYIRHKKKEEKLAIFSDFATALRHRHLPIYYKMDIYRVNLPKAVKRLVGSWPVIDEHFGARVLGSFLKNAGLMVLGAAGITAMLLDKTGILKTGIAQFVQAHGLEKDYNAVFGATTGIAFLWVILKGSQNKFGDMARDAKDILHKIVEGAHEKAKEERRAAKHARDEANKKEMAHAAVDDNKGTGIGILVPSQN